MKKEELLELALKLGIKKENFELGFEKDSAVLEKQILMAAEHMGLVEKKKKKGE